MVVIEVMTTTLIFLGIAGGFIVVAIVQLLTSEVNYSRDILILAIISGLFIFFLRVTMRKGKTSSLKKSSQDINKY